MKRSEYNKYHREYQMARYYMRAAYFRAYLGGKCSGCAKEYVHLEFDHVVPSQKEFEIKDGFGKFSSRRLLEECKKCQLLCKSCHTEKTRGELRKSVCKRGHARIPRNVYRRNCKECQRMHVQTYRAGRRRLMDKLVAS